MTVEIFEDGNMRGERRKERGEGDRGVKGKGNRMGREGDRCKGATEVS